METCNEMQHLLLFYNTWLIVYLLLLQNFAGTCCTLGWKTVSGPWILWAIHTDQIVQARPEFAARVYHPCFLLRAYLLMFYFYLLFRAYLLKRRLSFHLLGRTTSLHLSQCLLTSWAGFPNRTLMGTHLSWCQLDVGCHSSLQITHSKLICLRYNRR